MVVLIKNKFARLLVNMPNIEMSNVKEILLLPQKQEKIRLDVYLSQNLKGLSRSQIRKLLKKQGKKPSRLIKGGDSVEFINKPDFDQIEQNNLEPQSIPLNIVYEDLDLIVINKPAGLVVHPGAGNINGTLINALLYYLPNLQSSSIKRPGIVHRLDKNTSGLIIVAKHELSHWKLSAAFQNHEIRKIYRAWCVNKINKSTFELKTGHKRHPTNRKRFTTKHETTRQAHSKFEILNTFYMVSLKKIVTELKIEIFTGRTHQIRAQLADIGHPILGDSLYNGPKISNFDRHALHAEELLFKHPIENHSMHFKTFADFDAIQKNCTNYPRLSM